VDNVFGFDLMIARRAFTFWTLICPKLH
jgi:hypothetical protein